MTVPEDMANMGEMKGWGDHPLGLPPSCIEFCPAHPEYILVGTYNLQEGGEDYGGTANVPAGGQQSQPAGEANIKEEPDDDEGVVPAIPEQSRNGSLILVRNDNNDIKPVHTVKTPSAILDLHFHPGSPYGTRFGAVSSTGTFIMGRIDLDAEKKGKDGPIRIHSTSIIPDVGQDAIFTSFVWHLDMNNVVVITTSTGQVWLVALDLHGRIQVAQQLPLMSKLETWCVAMSIPVDKSGEHMIFAGGDDSILRYTSLKTLANIKTLSEEDKPLPSIKSGDTEEARDTMLWEQSFTPGPHLIAESPNVQQLIKHEHNAGVTAILPVPPSLRETGLIVTGSYDEYIRVFIMKSPHAHLILPPRAIYKKSLGGGVWKLQIIRWRVKEPKGAGRVVAVDILASCMHAGPKVVRLLVCGFDVAMEVIHEFEGHTLNYASHSRIREDQGVEFVTTSFYDKKLHWWTWDPPS